jgi:hypothetical protein
MNATRSRNAPAQPRRSEAAWARRSLAAGGSQYAQILGVGVLELAPTRDRVHNVTGELS